MELSGASLFQALTAKMRWHQQRQQVLAENVANADTPGYLEKDLKPFSTDDSGIKSVAMMTVSNTSPTQIHISSGGDADGFGDEASGTQVSPTGNSVTLEDEMMKVSSNDLDYQTVTALYTHSTRLIRVALGKDV
jgi:flagellar basal-body rod protein FlgB